MTGSLAARFREISGTAEGQPARGRQRAENIKDIRGV